MRQCLITSNIKTSNTNFVLFINIDSNFHIPWMVLIIELQHLNFGIIKAFFIQIPFDYLLRAISQIGGHLPTFLNTNLYLKVFLFALTQAIVSNVGYTWTLFQCNFQPNLITLNLCCFEFHIREQTLLPKTLERLCDLVTRHLYLIPNC